MTVPARGELATVEEKDVLQRLREVVRFGYGRLEVVVRNGEITTVNATTTVVAVGRR
jgi:hypothetical protein